MSRVEVVQRDLWETVRLDGNAVGFIDALAPGKWRWNGRDVGYAPTREAAISAVLKRADVAAWREWRGERPCVWLSEVLYAGQWIVEQGGAPLIKCDTWPEALAAANAQAVR